MDALAFALARIRLTSPLIARMQLGRDVVVEMGAGSRMDGACPFHYLVSGTARLVCEDRVEVLTSGDLIFLPRWPNYRIETGQAVQRYGILDLAMRDHAEQWSPDDGLDQSLIIEAGEEPLAATLLGGICLFEQPHLGSLLQDLPAVIVTNELGKGTEGLLQAVLAFVDEERNSRPGYAATAARLLEALLIETLRSWTLDHEHGPGRLRGMTDPKLARLLHHIHAKPGMNWNLATMASLAGQSRSKFAAHFKHAIGSSPADYVRHVRFETAQQQLLQGESVAKIAHDLNYSSSFAFSRAFQQHTGMSPAQLRRSRRMTFPDPA